MRWQRAAQALIAVFVIGFIVILATTLRRQAADPAAKAPTPQRETDAAVENPGGCEQITAVAGKRVFALKCGKHLMFKDGRNVLSGGVELTINRGGREFVVTSTEAEVAQKDDLIDRAVFKGNVRFTGEGGLEVTSEEASYSDNDGIVTIPGPLKFTKGRMEGSGVGATYDRNREVFWLLDQARISVAANPATGQGAVEGSAARIGLARAEHYIRLERDASLSGEGRVLQADSLVIHMTEDDERIQMMELRGNSRITGGPQNMSARDIDLSYAEDGRTLQNAHLVENAVVRLAAGGKRIAGNTVDITLGPDGSSVTNLTATERVRVDLPAEGQSPAKEIHSTALLAHGAPEQGLQNATFSGGVEYRETRAARAKTAALSRIARSDSLVIDTKPGLGAVEKADFRGNVTFTEAPDLSAEAPQAIYYAARDRIELMPGDGYPGPPPRVTDSSLAVSARTIAMNMTTREMNADTKVRSTMQPQKNRKGNGASSGKLPSMLDGDEPVNITANRLAYKGTGTPAVYSGAAMMWQGDETTIKAETISVDDKSGNLRAEGKATTSFNVDETDRKSGTRRRTPSTGSADLFTYDDARRLATYIGKAHIVVPQGDVTGEKIELFLKADVNELERAEAYGPGVEVREGHRIGTGTHLTYTAADDKYLLMGTPVEIIEEKKGVCSRMIGAAATFNRTTEATRLDGTKFFPAQTSTLPSCPAPLKR